MDKYGIRKQFKELYAPRSDDFEVVKVCQQALPQPHWIGSGEIRDGMAKAVAKNVPGLDKLRFETLGPRKVGLENSKPSSANPCGRCDLPPALACCCWPGPGWIG